MNEIQAVQLRDAALCKCARQQKKNHCNQERFLRCPAEPADDTDYRRQSKCGKLPQNKMQHDTGAQIEPERYPPEHLQTLHRCIQ